jgi:hypothetical protein
VTSNKICDLSADSWVNVKVVFDITNNVKDIYLNGTLVMEDLPLSNEDLTDYAPTSLYLVHYNGKTGGAVELDNFKCYYYEAE